MGILGLIYAASLIIAVISLIVHVNSKKIKHSKKHIFQLLLSLVMVVIVTAIGIHNIFGDLVFVIAIVLAVFAWFWTGIMKEDA